jgi:pimeloyl-ACP methyl ester carboxylesterase
MKLEKNIIIEGKHNKPIVLDFGYEPNRTKKPVVVFAHGFKGFKDWGHFNEVMKCFVKSGFAFVKFNFSHNGGTVEQPIDFPDLEAFGNNNYIKELDDLRTVIDWIENNTRISNEEIDKEQIYLIGHSRGGGISILAANEDKRIKKLVTWAAVSDFIKRLPQQEMEQWKKEGVIYIANGRTHQQMPMYYQFAENTLKNKDRLDIEQAAKNLTIPYLIIHGTADEAVNAIEAHQIKEWSSPSELLLINRAGHTFGAKHPFTDNELPIAAQQVIDHTINFFKK